MFSQVLGYFDWTWVITAMIAGLTYLIGSLAIKRRHLPPGPIPLPIIGNIWAINRRKTVSDLLLKWKAKYGDVFTIWIGPTPMVVVCGYDTIREGLITMKNAFSGRKSRYMSEIFVKEHQDVIFADYGPCWEALRKILALAVRKFSTSENLPILVHDVVNQLVPLMLAEKGVFDPTSYLHLTLYNILASTAFGKRYDMDDPEFLSLKNANDNFTEHQSAAAILNVIPMMRYILRGLDKKLRDLVTTLQKPVQDQYILHKETYKTGVIRDFTDACLAAQEEAAKEDKESAQYFTDGNMTLVIQDLFGAGTDTSRVTLTWILLYISNYPEVQERIRTEVMENIGDRMPVQDDKNKCPYTLAVIAETLRVRPIVTFTLEHAAICDARLGGHNIPKGTSMVFDIYNQQNDPEFWNDPQVYRPERFLEEDGSFMTNKRYTGFLPFGLGRRACPGEKLARADLFLILTGLIQKCKISLENGPGTADLEPMNIIAVNMPKPYKIKVEKV